MKKSSFDVHESQVARNPVNIRDTWSCCHWDDYSLYVFFSSFALD